MWPPRRLPERPEADRDLPAGLPAVLHSGHVGVRVVYVLEGVLGEDEVEPLLTDVIARLELTKRNAVAEVWKVPLELGFRGVAL